MSLRTRSRDFANVITNAISANVRFNVAPYPVNDVTITLMENDVKQYIHRYLLNSALDVEKLLDSSINSDLKMSIIRRIFKRNKRSNESKTEILDNPDDEKDAKQPIITELDADSENVSVLSSETDFSSGTDIDDVIDIKILNKQRQLNNALRKVRRQETRLGRRQNEILALDTELAELTWLTSLARRQKHALDHEVLNKKCELRILKNEAPESSEAEVRKREPLFFKKYNAIKTSADAKNMMHTVRQRQKALQYLELMVYNKYLELQYNLKSEDVKKRAALLSKDKTKHFGHLFDALNLRSNLEAQVLNQPTNSERSSPGIPSLISDMPSENSSPSSTTDTPTTAVQVGSQPSTLRGGTLTNNRLVFHLATPPRTNDRSPTPLLESFI